MRPMRGSLPSRPGKMNMCPGPAPPGPGRLSVTLRSSPRDEVGHQGRDEAADKGTDDRREEGPPSFAGLLLLAPEVRELLLEESKTGLEIGKTCPQLLQRLLQIGHLLLEQG